MKELDLEYDEDLQDIQDVEEKEVLAEKLADIEADDLSGIDDDELKQKEMLILFEMCLIKMLQHRESFLIQGQCGTWKEM